MRHLNVEIKARCPDPAAFRKRLRKLGATGPTADHQVDTYFMVPSGRLKLREGSVERALIHYDRPDGAGPKRSDVTLFPTGDDATALKEILSRTLGVAVVVKKDREIWWIDNVKIHVDDVDQLGAFVELEAIAQGGMTEEQLQSQCRRLMDALDISHSELVSGSYADMMQTGPEDDEHPPATKA